MLLNRHIALAAIDVTWKWLHNCGFKTAVMVFFNKHAIYALEH